MYMNVKGGLLVWGSQWKRGRKKGEGGRMND
jgi:hypothetical protein